MKIVSLTTSYSFRLLPSCCSVANCWLTLLGPMECNTPGVPVTHHLPVCAKYMSIAPVMPSKHTLLCRPHLLLLSIFPSIRSSNDSAVCIRWPNHWSFNVIFFFYHFLHNLFYYFPFVILFTVSPSGQVHIQFWILSSYQNAQSVQSLSRV